VWYLCGIVTEVLGGLFTHLRHTYTRNIGYKSLDGNPASYDPGTMDSMGMEVGTIIGGLIP